MTMSSAAAPVSSPPLTPKLASTPASPQASLPMSPLPEPASASAPPPLSTTLAPTPSSAPTPAHAPAPTSKATSTPPPPPSIASPIDDTIARQVEWYLSRHNLPTDSFLKQHMDTDYWVPLDLILTFPRMKALGAKDAARVASLLHARAPDIEVDAAAGRIRPAWVLRSNLILRDVPTTVTYAEIATLLRIPYTPNGVVPARPVSDAQPPHFAGLSCVLQVAESTWLAIFDKPGGAQDALPAIDGIKLQGQKIAAQAYNEGLEPQDLPYVPTVYQAMPNTYAPSTQATAAASHGALPNHSSAAPHDGIATYPLDPSATAATSASMYPYAYIQYPHVPHGSVSNPGASQPASYTHQVNNDSSSAPSRSPRRSSPSARGNSSSNNSSSQVHRMNGPRINGHRRAQNANGRSNMNNGSGVSTGVNNNNIVVGVAEGGSRSPTHGQNSRRRMRTTRRPGGTPRQSSPGNSNAHQGLQLTPANAATNHLVTPNGGVSVAANGVASGAENIDSSSNGSSVQLSTHASQQQQQHQMVDVEPAPDVSAMHFPPLSTPPAAAMSAESGSTWRRDAIVSSNSSPKITAVSPSTESAPISCQVSLGAPKDVVAEPVKEVLTGSTASATTGTPRSYASILRSRPLPSAPPLPSKGVAINGPSKGAISASGTTTSAVRTNSSTTMPSNGGSSEAQHSSSERSNSGVSQLNRDTKRSNSDGRKSQASGNVATEGGGEDGEGETANAKAKRHPRSPGVWACKPASVVKAVGEVSNSNMSGAGGAWNAPIGNVVLRGVGNNKGPNSLNASRNGNGGAGGHISMKTEGGERPVQKGTKGGSARETVDRFVMGDGSCTSSTSTTGISTNKSVDGRRKTNAAAVAATAAAVNGGPGPATDMTSSGLSIGTVQ